MRYKNREIGSEFDSFIIIILILLIMPQTHSTAINSYNSNHSLYDQLRPSFSPKIVDQFLVDLGLGSIKDNKIVYDNKKKS